MSLAQLDSDLEQSLQPPLKWAGGKRWLVPILEKHWLDASNRRLIEPFCGGLAVALGLKPESAFLNDFNPHLINFYIQLQKGLVTKGVFENNEKHYYETRESFNQLIADEQMNTEEAATYFYYLNRTGYNGLCRFNQKGFFNVPFGKYKTINYMKDFREYKPLLSKWEFACGDFGAIKCAESDFVYADPPYDVQFVSYSKGGFSWDDQVRLAKWLSQQPCPVIASNQATERILKIYEDLGFEISLLEAPRRISCTGDRTPAKEMLAFKGV